MIFAVWYIPLPNPLFICHIAQMPTKTPCFCRKSCPAYDENLFVILARTVEVKQSASCPVIEQPSALGVFRPVVIDGDLLWRATTLMMKPMLRTMTTNGSTFRPGLSSVYSFSMVELLPPAPAARVLEGRALATLSARSAAAFLLIAVAGPPGGFGEAGRAVVEPVEGAELTGEEGRGEDCEDEG